MLYGLFLAVGSLALTVALFELVGLGFIKREKK